MRMASSYSPMLVRLLYHLLLKFPVTTTVGANSVRNRYYYEW